MLRDHLPQACHQLTTSRQRFALECRCQSITTRLRMSRSTDSATVDLLDRGEARWQTE
jgi:hypothetical protein